MDELSELDHIRISNRGDGFQNTSSEQPGSLKYTKSLCFLRKTGTTTRSTLSTSAQKSKFLTSIKFSLQNSMRILENWT